MSSKASTTIGFERRFNPSLAHDDVSLFVAESTGTATPRPPNMQRIVELNRGPFVGAESDPEELPAAARGGAGSRRASRSRLRRRPPARSAQRSRLGHAVLDEGAFVLEDGPVVVAAGTEEEAAEAIRGLRAVAILDIAGFVLGGGIGAARASSRIEQLDELLAYGRGAGRRAREGRARLGLHRRQPEHPVSPARARGGRPPARPADRHDLRDGAARGNRGEHPRQHAGSTRTRSWTAASTRGSTPAARRSSSGAAAGNSRIYERRENNVLRGRRGRGRATSSCASTVCRESSRSTPCQMLSS